MICITDFLAHIRLTMKLQEQMLKNICETWQLTITEGKVISFLYNNPGKDTAADSGHCYCSGGLRKVCIHGCVKRNGEISF